jgi:hypothetical protein
MKIILFSKLISVIYETRVIQDIPLENVIAKAVNELTL